MPTLTRRSFLMQSVALTALPRIAAAYTTTSNAHIIDMGNAAYLDRKQSRPDLDALDGCTRPNHDFYDALPLLDNHSRTHVQRLRCSTAQSDPQCQTGIQRHGEAIALGPKTKLCVFFPFTINLV